MSMSLPLLGRSRDRNGYLLPATVSWTEKKLAAYFDIPLLAGDTSICETLYSKVLELYP